VGPTDCLLEGELLKLGGPFLQMWQRKHAKLYPNRLEFYNKTRDGHVVRGKEGKGVEVTTVLLIYLLTYLLTYLHSGLLDSSYRQHCSSLID